LDGNSDYEKLQADKQIIIELGKEILIAEGKISR
jgi:hypothetical protein